MEVYCILFLFLFLPVFAQPVKCILDFTDAEKSTPNFPFVFTDLLIHDVKITVILSVFFERFLGQTHQWEYTHLTQKHNRNKVCLVSASEQHKIAYYMVK